MKAWQRNGIVTTALLVFGAARLPFEAGLAKELRASGLTKTALAAGTRERIGQTSAAVALGGLRTLVATFLNLKAFAYFEERRWNDLEETYDTIVDLAPGTPYYWYAGSSHLAYDAASYYINDSKLPALRRREAWRESIERGRAFLERGIQNNPDDWNLLSQLGYLLADPNKVPAFRDRARAYADSADAYRRAADTGKAPAMARRAQLYSLARVPGRGNEALALARSLYEDSRNHLPTLTTLLLVLESHENPALDTGKRAVELFSTPQAAYETLSNHWRMTRKGFPVHGVAAALETLEKQLGIPAEKSVFKQPLQPPADPTAWFSE